MKRMLSLLRALLPQGTGEAAAADLERELALRQQAHGERWTDGWWLARVGLVLVVLLRLAKAGRLVLALQQAAACRVRSSGSVQNSAR